MNGVTFGLSISDRKQTYIAVTISKDEPVEYGQPLYWVESEGYTVTTKYPHFPNIAGVYFGDEIYGMRCAATREGFRGIFVLVNGLVPQPVKIKVLELENMDDPLFVN
jgi:hypothetical protein